MVYQLIALSKRFHSSISLTVATVEAVLAVMHVRTSLVAVGIRCHVAFAMAADFDFNRVARVRLDRHNMN